MSIRPRSLKAVQTARTRLRDLASAGLSQAQAEAGAAHAAAITATVRPDPTAGASHRAIAWALRKHPAAIVAPPASPAVFVLAAAPPVLVAIVLILIPLISWIAASRKQDSHGVVSMVVSGLLAARDRSPGCSCAPSRRGGPVAGLAGAEEETEKSE